MLYDSVGAQFANLENQRPIYYSSAVGIVGGTSATDIWALSCDGTKALKLLFMAVWGIATTAIHAPVSLIKRSALDTGGTAGALVAVPANSNFPVSTATCVKYTSTPPTTGAVVGAVANAYVTLADIAVATGFTTEATVWDFSRPGFAPPTLVTAVEQLCLNLGGVTYSGNLFNVYAVWSEGAL